MGKVHFLIAICLVSIMAFVLSYFLSKNSGSPTVTDLGLDESVFMTESEEKLLEHLEKNIDDKKIKTEGIRPEFFKVFSAYNKQLKTSQTDFKKLNEYFVTVDLKSNNLKIYKTKDKTDLIKEINTHKNNIKVFVKNLLKLALDNKTSISDFVQEFDVCNYFEFKLSKKDSFTNLKFKLVKQQEDYLNKTSVLNLKYNLEDLKNGMEDILTLLILCVENKN